MGKTRRRFTDEFKRQVARMCGQPGAVVTQLANKPGVEPNVLPVDVEPSDVVQSTIVRLADKGVDRPYLFVARLTQRVANDRVHRDTDTQGICQNDWCLDRPELSHLGRSGELSKCVADLIFSFTFGIKIKLALGFDIMCKKWVLAF